MSEGTRNLADAEGFVLAGGLATRFGRDKALAAWRGRPLLAWALDALAQVGVAAAVVAPQAARYSALGGRRIATEEPGLGPAEGLRAALAACRVRWALVLAVDMPLAGPALLRPLLDAARGIMRGPDAPRAVCWEEPAGRLHPLPAVYARELLTELEASPRGGPLMRALDAARPLALGPDRVPSHFPHALAAALRSVNEPRDLPG